MEQTTTAYLAQVKARLISSAAVHTFEILALDQTDKSHYFTVHSRASMLQGNSTTE